MQQPDIKFVIRTVEAAARVMLENGGETYRIEETVVRMCAPFGFARVEVIAFPTGLLLSIGDDESSRATIKRIPARGVNLSKIEQANDISRGISNGTLPLDEAYRRLTDLLKPAPKRTLWMAVAAGLSSGCFALAFSGSAVAFACATLAGLLIRLLITQLERRAMPSFVYSLLGGALAAFAGHGAAALFALNASATACIVSGAIMPMLPGLALTNAIRDTIHGDLLSGASRLGEAVLVSVALAAGAGIALHFMLGGGAS